MEVLANFVDPVKRQPLQLVLFRLEEIEAPPFQRDVSEGLKRQLEVAIEKLGFLTPIVVVPRAGKYYVVDGRHRLEAMRSLGAREITAIVVDEGMYHYILEFNTEKPPNVREKAKQTYRLYQDFCQEDPELIEEDLYTYFKEPMYITFGFAIEELDKRFPASFYENLVEKVDQFLRLPLREGLGERRKRAQSLIELNEVVNQKYGEFGWDNALLKGEIVRKAVQRVYGLRVRTIEDVFYSAVERVKEVCQGLNLSDFRNLSEL